MLELDKLYNVDCMQGMKEFPDKYFDLAIVDVPYGIGESNKAYLRGGKQPGNALAASAEYTRKQWDKDNGANDFADCELAWTSFNTAVRRYKYRWHGMLQENMKEKEVRIHPTQKPVALYAWLLERYAKYGDVILDTHVGSASSLVACYRCGFHFVGFEIDPEYYTAANERLSAEMSQVRLF